MLVSIAVQAAEEHRQADTASQKEVAGRAADLAQDSNARAANKHAAFE